MSKKSDLLVRVRYQNPLPQPPFPPKLLDVPTTVARLARPSYLEQLAASTPLAMLVDSEMGMHINLNSYDGVWNGEDQSLNPIPDPDRVHNPIDLTLLAPFNPPPTATGEIKSAPSATDVSWMRNNSYITRRNNARRKETAAEAKEDEVVDASEAAQLLTIEKSFLDIATQDPKEVKHPDPKKRYLTVVDSYDILPDDEAWSNNYILLRFPERPSASTAVNPAAGASSPRLAKSILRPIVEDEQQMMDFYLPQEEDVANIDGAYNQAVDEEPLQRILQLSADDTDDPEIDRTFANTHYDRIRTYEVVSTVVPEKEVLVSFQEEESRHRREELDNQDDRWDKGRIGFRKPNETDAELRRKGRSRVADPGWANEQLRAIHGGENMAEGQGEAIDDEQDEPDDGALRAERAARDEDSD
ncbi:RNA polymerase II-associated factor 1 [Cryptococcus wingfieldii CBS 7118]|uniref:RNA polymerase II-associated factor 1 n=1 Tax=Cryptococcus wingfieldii CBS 7118 TaxID=1295528 RepID=A0A1E3I338_9TREE|nr:RNA polymerase II-associated factor 1 [Cryptococcus wingfieldii CBS 7118]ODN82326.1 RNA polymerase II-associated factor 1 [Cryptococcus wingfieldii CBS 7118]